jgi:hypothetical protein
MLICWIVLIGLTNVNAPNEKVRQLLKGVEVEENLRFDFCERNLEDRHRHKSWLDMRPSYLTELLLRRNFLL